MNEMANLNPNSTDGALEGNVNEMANLNPNSTDGALEGNENEMANSTSTGTISGNVWLDKDSDGQKGPLDTGMADVVVHLVTSNGATVLQTTTTNPSGDFLLSINDISMLYTYTVTVENPNSNYFAFLTEITPENAVNNYGGTTVDIGPGAIEGTVNAGMQLKPGVKVDVCTSNDKKNPKNPCHFMPSAGLF